MGRGVICTRHSSARVNSALPPWNLGPQSCLFSGDSLFWPFPLQFLISMPHSVFAKRCFISSSVSSCTKQVVLAWAIAHLGKRRSLSDGLQWRMCFLNRALHSVDPKSPPEVLHIQSHSCSSIWLTDKFRICPAGDPVCVWVLQSTTFGACSFSVTECTEVCSECSGI